MHYTIHASAITLLPKPDQMLHRMFAIIQTVGDQTWFIGRALQYLLFPCTILPADLPFVSWIVVYVKL